MPKTSALTAATLPLQGTELMYLSDDGVDRKITAADLLAAGAPLISSVQRFGSALSAKLGSPSKTPIADVDVYRMDAAGTEAVGETIPSFPDHWTGRVVRTTLRWCNVTADAGNVVWRLECGFTDAAPGSIAGKVVQAAPAVTATAGAQSVFLDTVLDTDLLVVAGAPLSYTLTRLAADAADTKIGDAGVFRLLFEVI